MREFALIFHQTRALPPEELAARNAAARDWALGLRRDGILNAASPLEDHGFVVTGKGVAPLASGRTIASVLIIQADNLDTAISLARRHPGLALGTEIEVRPVKAVARQPPGS